MTARTIAEAFAASRSSGRIALMPFIAAGFPDLETTRALIPAIESAGADLIEVGFPFSDPIADGPVIAEAFTTTLLRKIKLPEIFSAVASVRSSTRLPLVAMLSYSIVFRYGVDRFVREAKAAGFGGLILPDLPPPEADRVCDQIRAGGLDTTLLVAPTTTPERRKQIAKLCSGFVYYMSLSGITGERDTLPPDVEANVRQLKSLTDTPVCVGFGINRPEHVRQLKGVADGAIVGSAVVRRIKQMGQAPPGVIAESIGTYCRELLGGA